jgi:long-chain acyl-CoA synthetase
LTFQFLVKEGEKIQEVQRDEPQADSVLLLGITSGTTGDPKMAMLTHRNLISGQVAADYIGFNFTENDVYLSYVPLTHVYEQITHAGSIMYGYRIGYSSDGTNNLLKDMQRLQPTFFGSFPAFYNKIHT